MLCERHHVVHYGQCLNCLLEATASLGYYSNHITAQQAPTLESVRKSVEEIKASGPGGPASGWPPIGSILKDYEAAANTAMNQFLVTTGVYKSPRTIAEVRKASEAPRYFDKHGTEIFKGDHYRVWEGSLEGHWRMDDGNWNQTVASMIEVLSRADGTPVYRYKGGEDVRDDDFFKNHIGGEECVHRGPWAKPPRITKEKIEEARNHWLGCTLIRRAGNNVHSSSLSVVDELTKLSEAEYSEIAKRLEGERAARALKVFADWCNQPTLSQRFEAFKRRVTDVILGLRAVTATFDFNQELGPFVVLRCKGILLEAVYDERSEKQISQKLDHWARDLGWDILRGTK